MKDSAITVTDQFCGAGGSSEGVKRFATRSKLRGGLKVRIALNHWKLAIETHNTNHPDTDHDCTDISACDPRRYPSTNILITSPECTNHSLAKGKRKSVDLFTALDPAAERSRATMWDVCRFAEYHAYELIIVENVVDARHWVMWDAWLKAMHLLGYKHQCVYLNSMHMHPTPQSRDRMYVVFWKKGNRRPNLDITPKAYCAQCAKDIESVQSWKNSAKPWGKYKQQYVYRCPSCTGVVEPYYYAAFNCIDWSIPGTRIGDRKKPLSDNTMKRIQYGIDKYWNQPTMIGARYIQDMRVKPLTQAMPTQTSEARQYILNPMLAVTGYPPLVSSKEYDIKKQRIRNAMTEAGFTQSTHQNIGVVLPFLIKNYGGPPQAPIKAIDPLGTVTTQDHHGIVIENFGTSKARAVTQRLGAITAGGGNYGILTNDAMKSFLSYYYSGSEQASHILEATRSFRTGDTASLIKVGDVPKIEDCSYRMLLPHEVKLGMAFEESYIVLGSGKDQVKQLGNAVTPPAMEFLIERCVETLL